MNSPTSWGNIPGQPVHDRAGMKQVEIATRAALPEIHYEIAHLIAEGDWVVHHWTATATHSGEFMGIPPTVRALSWWLKSAVSFERCTFSCLSTLMRPLGGLTGQPTSQPVQDRAAYIAADSLLVLCLSQSLLDIIR